MRRAAKRDATEGPIRAALEAEGFRVASISHPGLPDLLVWRRGVPMFVLLECKSPGGELTPAQLRFWTDSAGTPRFEVRDPETAVRVARVWIDERGGSLPGAVP